MGQRMVGRGGSLYCRSLVVWWFAGWVVGCLGREGDGAGNGRENGREKGFEKGGGGGEFWKVGAVAGGGGGGGVGGGG